MPRPRKLNNYMSSQTNVQFALLASDIQKDIEINLFNAPEDFEIASPIPFCWLFDARKFVELYKQNPKNFKQNLKEHLERKDIREYREVYPNKMAARVTAGLKKLYDNERLWSNPLIYDTILDFFETGKHEKYVERAEKEFPKDLNTMFKL